MIKPDKITKCSRKSIAIIINSQAQVIVRAPYSASNSAINNFVKEKQDWIVKKVTLAKKNMQKYNEKHCCDGEKFHYLGRELTLKLIETKKVYQSCDFLFAPKNAKDIQNELFKWFYLQAKSLFKERLDFYKSIMKTEYSGFSLSKAKTKWGSCSGKDKINLSWKLIKCPLEMIDYVVIHELCHTIQKNHSKLFWAEVEKYCPKYKAAKKWLKENSGVLTNNF